MEKSYFNTHKNIFIFRLDEVKTNLFSANKVKDPHKEY